MKSKTSRTRNTAPTLVAKARSPEPGEKCKPRGRARNTVCLLFFSEALKAPQGYELPFRRLGRDSQWIEADSPLRSGRAAIGPANLGPDRASGSFPPHISDRCDRAFGTAPDHPKACGSRPRGRRCLPAESRVRPPNGA